jgi:hypothetical protein
VFRVLKNNGHFILIVDNFNYPFLYDPINYNRKKPIEFGAWNWRQLRRFEQEKLVEQLQKTGFIIEKIEKINHHLICCLNYPECIFYNSFFPSNQKDSYIKDKKNNQKQKNIPKSIISILDKKSKIICDIDNHLFKKSNGANILIVARKEKE